MGHSERRVGIGAAHGGSCVAADRRIEEAGRGKAGAALEAAPTQAWREQLVPNRSKALVAWSSGKDSAWALHEVRRAGDFDIVGALTTVTDTFGRVSMHGIRENLLREQLDAAGLPATVLHIPFPCTNEIYEWKMAAAIEDARAFGVTHMIFGDLFLADVRGYRERQLTGTGITPIFPVWGRQTAELAREMIDNGVQAHLSTVDLQKLPAPFAGRRFDGTARCIAGRRRSVRRKRRISLFCVGGPDAFAED